MKNIPSAHRGWLSLAARLALAVLWGVSGLGGPVAARAAQVPARAAQVPAQPVGAAPRSRPPPTAPLAASNTFSDTLDLYGLFGSGSVWHVSSRGGTTNTLPSGTVDDSVPGLAVVDASAGPRTDAFDYGLSLWVNNQIYAPTEVTTATNKLDFSSETMSGLNVTAQYFVAYNSQTLRELVTLENNTASPISRPIYWASNLGSDFATTINDESHSDGMFTPADRWIVTDDGAVNHDPAVTHVFFGPGLPVVTASSVVTNVFQANGTTPGVGATFNVTIPANATRYLMFFSQLNEDPSLAGSNARAMFDANPPDGGDFLTGVSHDMQLHILNWAFTNSVPLAHDDSLVALTNGGPQPLFVLENDSDADNDKLVITAVTAPAHGAARAVALGNNVPYIAYTPTTGYAGPDTFGYTISDGFGGSASAQVNLSVGSQFVVSLPWNLTAGPDAHSIWQADNGGGSDNGLPQGGSCASRSGVEIHDATAGANKDAFDEGLSVWLDNQVITTTTQVTVTAHSLDTSPMPSAGLSASMSYYGLAQSDTLRTVATFYNPLGSPVAATITFVSNYGSDSNTGVRASSDGNTTFSAVDRWVVTSDDPGTPNDPVITQALFGPGPVPVPVNSVSRTVYDCSGTEGVLATYHLVVSPGATRRLMFFTQLNQTNAVAISAASAFDGPLTPDMLAGLSAAARSQIANWIMPHEVMLPLVRR